jgi:predicted outer membrane repeat protein
MKYIIITLVVLVSTSQAESQWGLKSDTEARLSAALALNKAGKLSQKNKAGNSYVTVGDDGSCDFRVGANRIQNAVDSGAFEIRIASNTTYQENVLIDNSPYDLVFKGGYADCSEAQSNNQSNEIDDRAEITRVIGQVTSVFRVVNLPEGVTTTFENLKIIGGDSNQQGSGGAVSFNSTDSDGIFNNVWMTGTDQTFTGGGLSVVSSSSIIVLNNTDIFENSVVSGGGGIYCTNFTAQLKKSTIIIGQDSNVYRNSANSGGGVLLGKDCFLALFSGKESGNKGISLNTAITNGGGINAFGGSTVLIYGHIICDLEGECFGNSTDPASFFFNRANILGGNNSGGAIAASDFNTSVTIVAGDFRLNSSFLQFSIGGAGGVVSLHNQASLEVSHPGLSNSTVSCWDAVKCNYFSSNKAHFGGAFYTNDGNINISHAYFEENFANLGTAMYVSGSENLSISSSIFTGNGSNVGTIFDEEYLIQAHGPAVDIDYTTIADNKTALGVFLIAPSSSLDLQSSIVHDEDSGNVINSGSGTIISNCVMAHEISSFSGTNTVLDDPEFIDRANGNYHLNPSTSPAIDFCSQFPTGLNKDIDYQERGFDNLSLSNFQGSFDLGADESYDKTFLTVGGDASCDFNTSTQSIQDAVDTGIGEIRIAANGTHNKTILIGNINIKLRGGYADCTAADNDVQTTKTDIIVTIGTIEPVITIAGITQRNVIVLERLNLTGLGASAVTIINANASILISNVEIKNNVLAPGFFGGGLFVSQSNAEIHMVDSIITQNSAPQAGGIYCSGSGASIVMSGNSGLSQNTTTGKGGGAYITGGCEFTMYSGSPNPTALTTVGISANIADEEGGGIYADFGGKIVLNGHKDCSQTCIGDNSNPVSVNHNKSNGGVSSGERGGGIYMTGTGTTVNVYAGLFSENLSPNGGAIYVNDFATLKVERLSKECWDPVKCNYFFKNRSLGAGTGGAIQNDQGFLHISSAYFEENESRTGSVLYAFGSNSHNTFESSVFNHNNNQGTSDNFVIRAAMSSNVEISHSTFADNYIVNTTVFGITSDSELRLFSSIVHETDGDVLDENPGNIVSDCLMVHEAITLSGTNSTNLYLDDPEFVDRNNRDYHLNMNNSPAIDVCDNSMVNLQFKDIDFDERGIDDVNVNNVNGLYDMGADEAVFHDLIFKNGFE